MVIVGDMQALNDVASGFGECGIFDLENWSDIVNSSFNSAFNSNEEMVSFMFLYFFHNIF